MLSASDMENDLGDNTNWLVDINGTASSPTGPTANGGADHNPGVAGGKYVYTESSSCLNATANLVSPYYDFTSLSSPYVEFWYHMYGATMGTMHFDVDTTQGAGSWITDYIPSWTDNQDLWQQQLVSLAEFAGMDSVRFRVRGITGSSFTSDMALDDFTVNDTVFSILSAVTQPSCDGFTDGAITVQGIFGANPVAYAWSSGGTTASISGLAEGTYTVTATDNNGTTAVETFVLDVPAIVPTATVLQDIICSYDEGVGTVVATGGTPITASYLMDTASANYDPAPTTNATELPLGDEQLSSWLPVGFDFVFFGDTFDEFRVSSNGFITFDPTYAAAGCCSGQLFPNSTQPNAVIALNWEDLDPDNGNAGTVYYETVGTAPFRTLIVTFQDVAYWLGTMGEVSVQAKLFETSNCIEIHTIDVVDDAGTQTQGIENAAGNEGFAYPGRNATAWSGIADFISFCPPVGGLAYLWPDGVTDTINTNLVPGNHVVTITDQNGCFVTDTVSISAPVSDLDLAPSVTDITCYAANDGMITSNATNGVLPYTYTWSDSQTTADATALIEGTYGITVMDNVGCLDSVNGLFVEEPPLLFLAITSATPTNCPDSANGAASAVAQGGRSPYTFTWLPSGFGGQSVTGLTAGVQQAIVTDSSGCQAYQSVAILSDYPKPVVDLGPDQLITDGQPVTLNAGSHTTYQWSTSATTASITATVSGVYWVLVANDGGCGATDTVTLEIWPTGVEELGGASVLSIFPNPATDVLNISLNHTGVLSNLDIAVTNMQGQLVMTRNIVGMNGGDLLTLELDQLPAGAYNLSVKADGLEATRAFVKR